MKAEININGLSEDSVYHELRPGSLYYDNGHWYAVVMSKYTVGSGDKYHLLNLETFSLSDWPSGGSAYISDLISDNGIRPKPNVKVEEIVLGNRR